MTVAVADGVGSRPLSRYGATYVVETRTCEGFARLASEPEGGIGPLQGSFQVRSGTLTWVAEPKSENSPPAEAPAAQ